VVLIFNDAFEEESRWNVQLAVLSWSYRYTGTVGIKSSVVRRRLQLWVAHSMIEKHLKVMAFSISGSFYFIIILFQMKKIC
jgi:hypothetical protein